MLLISSSFAKAQWLTDPKDDVDLQFNVFFDPFGKAPSGDSGFQKGVSGTVIMNWGFIEGAVSNFSALKDGYNDVVVTMGINLNPHYYEPIRMYAGGSLGMELRGGARYEIMGLKMGIDWNIPTTNLWVGVYGSVHQRESQQDGRYGDSSAPTKNLIFTSSLATENGGFTIGARF